MRMSKHVTVGVHEEEKVASNAISGVAKKGKKITDPNQVVDQFYWFNREEIKIVNCPHRRLWKILPIQIKEWIDFIGVVLVEIKSKKPWYGTKKGVTMKTVSHLTK